MTQGQRFEQAQPAADRVQENVAIRDAAANQRFEPSGVPWNPTAIQAQVNENMKGVVNPDGQVNTDYQGALTGNGPGALYSPTYSVLGQLGENENNMSATQKLWMEHPEIAYQMMAGFQGGADNAAAQQAMDNWNNPKPGQYGNLQFNTADAAGNGTDTSSQDQSAQAPPPSNGNTGG